MPSLRDLVLKTTALIQAIPSPVRICRWGLGKALCDPKERKEMPENSKTMQLIRARLEARLEA